MQTIHFYPLKFKPIYHEKIWGGTKLHELLGRPAGNSCIGESWEICDRGKDQTVIKNGEWAGQTLNEVMLRLGPAFLGDQFKSIPERFPLLFKIIDAADDLSIQVHPNDQDAGSHGEKDPGKTEMWYILQRNPHSRLFCGLKPGTSPENLKQALNSSEIEKYLESFSTHPGDVFFIPAGTIHALGKGNLVIEIQENSDITYRLSDWGRLGADGKPRPLHIKKGLEVTQFDPVIRHFHLSAQDRPHPLIYCPYFEVHEILLPHAEYTEIMSRNSFQVWIFIHGEGLLNGVEYERGDFLLLPAHIGKIRLSAQSQTRFLRAFIPAKKG